MFLFDFAGNPLPTLTQVVNLTPVIHFLIMRVTEVYY